MAKSRAIAKRRSTTRKSGFKIPLGIVAGFVPGVAWAGEAVQAGNWNGAMERVTLAYTGIRPNPFTFTTGYLGKGLYPLLFGVMAHTLADRFGINKAISKLGLPVEI
jgi:hypothetical protein